MIRVSFSFPSFVLLLFNPKQILALGLTFLLVTSGKAQKSVEDNIGASIGISFGIGTAVNRFGWSANAFYFSDFIQINAAIRMYHNFQTLGTGGTSQDVQISLGAIGAWENRNDEYYLFLHPLSNQTGYENSVGYAYTIYWDNNQSSQSSGAIGLQISNYTLIHENDILAGTGGDRFRTGGFLIAYQNENMRYAVNYTSWTGDSKTKAVKKVKNSDYPAKRGYKDLSQSTHGKTSLGLLSAQFDGLFDHGQIIRANVGLDADQVRNFMQNKFMHELITKGVHYPMLDVNGDPYLFQNNQRVRPVQPLFQLQSNPPLFY